MDYEAEYKRALAAYYQLDQSIIDILGPALGYPTGPFPEVCGTCEGGPCSQIDKCSKQCLSAPYTAEDLAFEAAHQLKTNR
ncbi:hypothetical protein [Hymenobacter glacieicola]|uniref:Uncharacterized protein n=1 Tax=Hymenobacter glacieicola TaxID=1562124 RepID=A0ABQ1X8F0_9BACT|nr:hypothetical protein [Hymenobacter glacieicola]GGG61090.1 hypothetical protein GCM10011378_41380 [Hymenobacter glacieicola]